MPDALLTVKLTSSGTPKIGEPLLVGVEVRNVSAAPLWMVGVLDGSEAGVRYPHYQPTIQGPVPWSSEPLECGNVAPLRLSDFRHLMPGEGFDPTDPAGGAAFMPLIAFLNFRPQHSGVYELGLVLSTESTKAEEWLGMPGYPGEEEVLARLSQIPRLRIESNTLSINVS